MAEESSNVERQAGGESQGYGGPRRPRGQGGSGGPGGRRFQSKPKVCQFCVEKSRRIDYKQVDLLRRFLNDSGKIRPRRQTGTCARHQRVLTVALKRARHLALLPYVGSSSR